MTIHFYIDCLLWLLDVIMLSYAIITMPKKVLFVYNKFAIASLAFSIFLFVVYTFCIFFVYYKPNF